MVNPVLFTNSIFSRPSSGLSQDVIQNNIRRLQEEILLAQEQISSGIRLVRPSIDGIATVRVLDIEAALRKNEQYEKNIDRTVTNLNFSDVTLGNVKEIIDRARQIVLTSTSSPSLASQKQNFAVEVNELLRQAMNLANTTLEGRSIFGGSKVQSAPYSAVGNAVSFTGTNDELRMNVADSINVTSNILPDESFVVFSSGIKGENTTGLPIDLNPALTLSTRVSALNNGTGFSRGQFTITGAAAATVDVSIADTVSDIVDLINQNTTTTGITASINTTGIVLTRAGGGTIIVQELFGGNTAQSLGILTPAAGSPSPVTGTDLNPAVTKDTVLSSLLGGAGISTSGIVITQQASSGNLTATLGATVFAAANTVEDVLNAINNAGVHVDARINQQGTGIDVLSRLSGARLTISENGGTSASQLGILYTASRAKLTDLNNGFGIGSVDGDDIRFQLKNGTVLTLNVDTATDVREVVALIDGLPNLTAVLSATNQIVVTDTTGGAGNLRIDNLGGSFAASGLGIEAETTGTVITGTALNFVGVQVEGLFTALTRLRDGLTQDNTSLIQEADRLMRISADKISEARGKAGARVQTLELLKNRLENERLDLETFKSKDKDIDLAEAASRFQQQMNTLQAALLASTRALQLNIFNFL